MHGSPRGGMYGSVGLPMNGVSFRSMSGALKVSFMEVISKVNSIIFVLVSTKE